MAKSAPSSIGQIQVTDLAALSWRRPITEELRKKLAEDPQRPRTRIVSLFVDHFGLAREFSAERVRDSSRTPQAAASRLRTVALRSIIRCAPIYFRRSVGVALNLFGDLSEVPQAFQPAGLFDGNASPVEVGRIDKLRAFAKKALKLREKSSQDVFRSSLSNIEYAFQALLDFVESPKRHEDIITNCCKVCRNVGAALAGPFFEENDARLLQATDIEILDACILAESINEDCKFAQGRHADELIIEQIQPHSLPDFWPVGKPTWWSTWELQRPREAYYASLVIEKSLTGAETKSKDTLFDDATLPKAPNSGKEGLISVREIAAEREFDRFEAARQLQAQVRGLGVVKPGSLEEGQEIARSINNLLAQEGCCFCFPSTSDPAKIAYLGTRLTEPGGFYLAGMKDGRRTTEIVASAFKGESIRDDLSTLEVIPAPPRRPRSKK